MTKSDRTKVAVLISGRGSNLGALIDAASAADYPAQVALVVSNNPEAPGLELAIASGIPTSVIDHREYDDREVFDRALHDLLIDHGIALVCHAGFMRILSAQIVDKWRGKMLNIHPSLLPMLKGLHTHDRALDMGVRIHGCTVHFVTPQLDDGPIILQAAVPVLPADTAETLADRVLAAEHLCYAKALAMVATGAAKMVGERVLYKNVSVEETLLINPMAGSAP